jgi:hypothetical protein
MTSADSPHVDETTLCAAATGVRPGGGEFGTRAPTMWTTTAGSNFIYLARIDARLGPQEVPPNSQFNGLMAPEQIEELPSNVDTQIRDGYDSQYLSAAGTYCFLSELPATLNASVCNGATYSGSLNGVLDEEVSLSLSFPAAPATSFYVAVVRATTTDFPSIHTPIAGIAVMSDYLVVREEQGDAFVGDNVIFGFPGNGGFQWMTP